MRFAAKPSLYCAEALGAYTVLHLAEVSLCRNFSIVVADHPHVSASSESLHEVFDVRYLLKLAQHKRPQVAFRTVGHGLSQAFKVEPFRRMEWRGLKSNFSKRSTGEPDLFIFTNMTRSGSPNIKRNYLIRLRAKFLY